MGFTYIIVGKIINIHTDIPKHTIQYCFASTPRINILNENHSAEIEKLYVLYKLSEPYFM